LISDIPDEVMMAGFLRPKSIAEAVDALEQGKVLVLAGGTDLFPALGNQPFDGTILDVSSVPELLGITQSGETISIGGAATWSAIAKADLPRCFTALKQAAGKIGSIQIQNRGTIAGNLCNASPAADGIPPLLVLDAEVVLQSTLGTRSLPLHEFVVGRRQTQRRANELVTSITVPAGMSQAYSVFKKLGTRQYLVISIAMVAVSLRISDSEAGSSILDARVALGSCGPRALRLRSLEDALRGAIAVVGISHLVQRDHLVEFSPIDDVRASASYRLDAALILVQDALEECVAKIERSVTQ
jgi:CO/xanthine dehydrogenase FAD-binding subunit